MIVNPPSVVAVYKLRPDSSSEVSWAIDCGLFTLLLAQIPPKNSNPFTPSRSRIEKYFLQGYTILQIPRPMQKHHGALVLPSWCTERVCPALKQIRNVVCTQHFENFECCWYSDCPTIGWLISLVSLVSIAMSALHSEKGQAFQPFQALDWVECGRILEIHI